MGRRNRHAYVLLALVVVTNLWTLEVADGLGFAENIWGLGSGCIYSIYSKHFGLDCVKAIGSSYLTRRVDPKAPRCCKALLNVDKKCWPQILPSNPLFPTYLKRSGQLRRLQVSCCYLEIGEAWIQVFKKLPLLEEFGVILSSLPEEAIEVAGVYCPQLKIFRMNRRGFKHLDDLNYIDYADKVVATIVKGFPKLRHLQLIGNRMSNNGLLDVLKKCPYLESLDLRRCFNINIDGSLHKRCSDHIKKLWLPDDSLEGYKFIADDEIERSVIAVERE